MWKIEAVSENSDFYPILEKELLALIAGEQNLVANLANISSWIYHAFSQLNWCGFYLWSEEDQELVLGPFQGKPACIRIKADRGVCGAAYLQGKTIKVDDVHAFPGHIACDALSLSEVVIPLIKQGKVMGVLDLDSPITHRFSEKDAQELTLIINKIVEEIF
jgi:L-methionine (R)-S-oxide reductase